MGKNVGSIDRTLRAALGVILLGLAVFSTSPVFDAAWVRYVSGLIGIVMLVVAATRVCPVYSILGIKTCRV
jgi:thiol:disulfide interchange protein